MSTRNTILVTGGAGFIGGAFVELILDEGTYDEVVCFDKLTYAAQPERVEIHKADERYSFVYGDVCDKAAVCAALEKYRPQVIVNFAAESHVDKSLEDEDPFYQTNVVGVETLLSACLEYGTTRFVQISTDEVYGQRLEGARFKEDDSYAPRNPYARTKVLAEEIINRYQAEMGMETIITRGCNTFGTWQHNEKLLPKVIHNAFHGIDIPVYGSGLQMREWIAASEHARAIWHLIRNDRFGEIYNIGSGYECTNIDLVKLVLGIMDKSTDLIKHVEDRKGHDFQYGVNVSKLADSGWRINQDFESALRRMIGFEIDRLEAQECERAQRRMEAMKKGVTVV